MTTKVMGMGLVLAGALFTTACATQPDEFGTAVAEARARQTENPGASETVTPVEGLAKNTPEDVQRNYHRNQDATVQEQRIRRQRESVLVNTSGQ